MNILLIYPYYPDTYWSFRHALRFISKKAAVPPLGLITVSAMFPDEWNKKLVDLNVTSLQTDDLAWADYVFISAMYIQKESVDQIIHTCINHQVKIVAGGPLFTQEHDQYPDIDHFILNEAEITFQPFLKDLANGRTPRRIYSTGDYAEMASSPVPDYHLLNMKDYAFMNLQVSRGCPYNCDFCEITALLGHKVRMKKSEQVLGELQELYDLGWRGPVSIVDDNFIGQKRMIKYDLLPAMIAWMEKHNHPFSFNIQSSIELADDEELMKLLTSSGFSSAFVGIETPDEVSLHACNKIQNEKRDLLHSVKTIQQAGIQVSGGFIVGFDSDDTSVFQRQIDFINQSGIVAAMVGLLNAPKNTKLYRRMEAEKRLTNAASGSNTDMSMNFVPKMKTSDLLEGYKDIIQGIYNAKPYYKRTRQLLLNYKRKDSSKKKINFSRLMAFFKSMLIIGLLNKGRREYWKFLLWTIAKKPSLFTDAITFTVYGYHFRTVYGLRNARIS